MKKYIAALLTFFLPALAFAQQTFSGIITLVQNLIRAIGPIMVAIAVLFFFWEIIQYIRNTNPDEKQKAIRGIGLSLLAIFIMLAFMGIIRVIAQSLNIQTGGQITSGVQGDITGVQF